MHKKIGLSGALTLGLMWGSTGCGDDSGDDVTDGGFDGAFFDGATDGSLRDGATDADSAVVGQCRSDFRFDATGAEWTLPAGFGNQPFPGALFDQVVCREEGDILHLVLDVNGDRRADLLVTDDCNPATPLGKDSWSLYPGEASRFAATAQTLSLPARFRDQPGSGYWAQNVCGAMGDLLHSLVDMDADGRLDLLLTDDCSNGTALGSAQWQFHKGSATGFAEMATELSLPDGFGDQPSAGVTSDQGRCGDPGDYLHLLIDMDADRRPDLLVTDDCDSSTDLGKLHYSVFKNNGTAFADQATGLTLPMGFGDQRAAGFATDQAECGAAGDLLHVLEDMDGDGRPDLLVTDDCTNDTPVGKSTWQFHRNSGSTFGAAADWTMPTGFGDQATSGLASDQGSCGPAGDILHTMLDMDGDKRPDLLATDDCKSDTPTGATEYRIYRNTGSGFDATGAAWTLPAGITESGQPSLASDQECSATGDLLHVLTDANGDGRIDLIVTADCDESTMLGTTNFRLHAGSCR